MPFCENCKILLNPEDKFCKSCGSPATTLSGKDDTTKLVLAIVGGGLVLFLLLVGIGVYQYAGLISSNDQQSQTVILDNNSSQSFSEICNKIQPTEPQVRNTAVSIAKSSSGEWNVGQLLDLFEWMKTNVVYVSDPINSEYFASATETVNVGAGDCDDQAILIVSMVKSIHGTARIGYAAEECSHAFAEVFVSKDEDHFNTIKQDIADFYAEKGIDVKVIFSSHDSEGYWLIVDPAGGEYLGDLLPDCRGKKFQPIC